MMPPNSAPTRRSAPPTSAAERPGHPDRPASGQPGGIWPSGPDHSITSRHRTSPVPGWNLRFSPFSRAKRAARDRGIPCAWTHAERRQDGDAQKTGRPPHRYETPRSRASDLHRSGRSVLRPQPGTRTPRCSGPRPAVFTACCRCRRRGEKSRTGGSPSLPSWVGSALPRGPICRPGCRTLRKPGITRRRDPACRKGGARMRPWPRLAPACCRASRRQTARTAYAWKGPTGRDSAGLCRQDAGSTFRRSIPTLGGYR